MSRPNLPPSANDFARLLARVENLERRDRRPGPRTFGELDDVDATAPVDQTVATYVAASGKIELAPAGAGGGFPVGPEDDGTGTTEITAVALGGGTSASTWNNINDGDGSTAQILLATATDRAASQMGWTADSGAAVTDQRDAQGGPNTALWQIGTRNDAGDHICLFRALATASGSQNTVQAEIVEVVATAASGLIISGLPSTDPGVSGQLWADPITNIVMVSP